MPSFPSLHTNAVTQYPFRQQVTYPVFRHRFLDQKQQCFRVSAAPRRRWQIELSLLDEGEMRELMSFLDTVRGRDLSFSFTDPFDGAVHANCILEEDEGSFQEVALRNGRTRLSVISIEA